MPICHTSPLCLLFGLLLYLPEQAQLPFQMDEYRAVRNFRQTAESQPIPDITLGRFPRLCENLVIIHPGSLVLFLSCSRESLFRCEQVFANTLRCSGFCDRTSALAESCFVRVSFLIRFRSVTVRAVICRSFRFPAGHQSGQNRLLSSFDSFQKEHHING